MESAKIKDNIRWYTVNVDEDFDINNLNIQRDGQNPLYDLPVLLVNFVVGYLASETKQCLHIADRILADFPKVPVFFNFNVEKSALSIIDIEDRKTQILERIGDCNYQEFKTYTTPFYVYQKLMLGLDIKTPMQLIDNAVMCSRIEENERFEEDAYSLVRSVYDSCPEFQRQIPRNEYLASANRVIKAYSTMKVEQIRIAQLTGASDGTAS